MLSFDQIIFFNKKISAAINTIYLLLIIHLGYPIAIFGGFLGGVLFTLFELSVVILLLAIIRGRKRKFNDGRFPVQL